MTAEEYIINKLEEYEALCTVANTRIETQEKKIHHLESIVDTLKEHAKFDGEYIHIMVGGYNEIKERNFLVKELGLTKEDEN